MTSDAKSTAQSTSKRPDAARPDTASPMPAPAASDAAKKDTEQPDWANGLRQLYDSVVDEPLPDSFTDLLSQLDNKG